MPPRRRRARVSAFTGLMLLCGAFVFAQPAYRVKDIAAGDRSGGIAVGELAAFQGRLYFGASDRGSREQLWQSDGRPNDARKIRDFDVAGQEPPKGFTATASRMYFFASGALWRIDDDGTTTLATALPGGAMTWETASLGEFIFFGLILDGQAESSLWRSDGTADGTVMVAPSFAGGLTRVGEQLLYFAPSASDGTALWRIPDAESDPMRVLDSLGPDTYDQASATASGDRLFFVTRSLDSTTFRLWVSDRTSAGTVPVASFVGDSQGPCPLVCPPPQGPSDFTAFNGGILMVANDGTHGRELWKSDGTVAGTALVLDHFDGQLGGFVRAGSLVYFNGNDAEHGSELWKTDGTAAGTALVADLIPGPDSSYAFPNAELGGRLVFTIASDDLWITDGTPAGTSLVRDLAASFGSYPYGFTPFGNSLVFSIPSGDGSVLWKTDGTEPGTVIADGFATGASSNPILLGAARERAVFAVFEPDPTAGVTLWGSDGTDGGTQPISSFKTLGSILTSQFVLFHGDLYFAADDGVHGTELWRTDGTAEGTRMVRDILPGPGPSSPWSLTAVGNTLFFAAWDGEHQNLWATDGTESGTRFVSQAAPYGETTVSVALGNLLIYVGDDRVNGAELWRSDGTESGTYMLANLTPGPDGSGIYSVVSTGARVFFNALYSNYGLWVTDGTTAGTVRVSSEQPYYPAAAGSLLFFINAAGTALWRSDGTPAGTFVVANLIQAQGLTASGGTLYFAGDDGEHGVELWASDGTVAGTRMVRDIRPGPEGSRPSSFAASEDGVVFSADDGVHGDELWTSSATETSTRLVQDVAAGSPSSNPATLVRAGDLVFFSADDGIGGNELWAVPLASIGAPPERELAPLAAPPKPTRTLPERP